MDNITQVQKGFTPKLYPDITWLFLNKKNKDKFSSIVDWVAEWIQLPQEEKNWHVDEARQVLKGNLLEEPKKARQMLLKKLDELVQELHKADVSLACLAYVGTDQLEHCVCVKK